MTSFSIIEAIVTISRSVQVNGAANIRRGAEKPSEHRGRDMVGIGLGGADTSPGWEAPPRAVPTLAFTIGPVRAAVSKSFSRAAGHGRRSPICLTVIPSGIAIVTTMKSPFTRCVKRRHRPQPPPRRNAGLLPSRARSPWQTDCDCRETPRAGCALPLS